MDDFYRDWLAFLEAIRTRPGIWLGARSVTRLGAFIGGFRVAEQVHGVTPLGGFDFSSFEPFVESKAWSSSAGSYLLALQIAKSEEAGFDLWFEWYDAFRRSLS